MPVLDLCPVQSHIFFKVAPRGCATLKPAHVLFDPCAACHRMWSRSGRRAGCSSSSWPRCKPRCVERRMACGVVQVVLVVGSTSPKDYESMHACVCMRVCVQVSVSPVQNCASRGGSGVAQGAPHPAADLVRACTSLRTAPEPAAPRTPSPRCRASRERRGGKQRAASSP